MPLNELLNVVFRWAHVIAGIMWIGNSMLFNWLDRNLETDHARSRLSQGKLVMVHSGAFYDVEKKLLEPGQMPERLHWFKWQNGFTWLTGISLLVVVYYMNGAGALRDPHVANLDASVACTLSVASLFCGWLAYDALWRIFGEANPRLANLLSIALLFGAIWGFAQAFSGPGAYMQTGVLIGTIMTGNVWLCIMPSQKSLIAATQSGLHQDPVLSLRAKQRSIHNNYLTFPLLFIMISNHFPSATGAPLNWLVLIVVMIGGAGVRHFMNWRYLGGGQQRPKAAWLAPAVGMGGVVVVGLLVLTNLRTGPKVVVDHPVDFARVEEIVSARCVPCHSQHPTDKQFPVAPKNVVFDSPDAIRALAPRIKAMVVDSQQMPFLNRTNISELERAEIGAWIDAGALLK